MKTVQYFTDEYLQQCRAMTPDQIIRFLDEFRQLHGVETRTGSKLISIKVQENLLSAFKARAELAGVPYQTQIKKLMKTWITEAQFDNS
jgi:predicted DNA binding CopG/RHH family protein